MQINVTYFGATQKIDLEFGCHWKNPVSIVQKDTFLLRTWTG
jgi:hypothetical protein